jgi:hypothetical protein
MKVSLLGVGLLALTSTIGFAQAAPAPTAAPAPMHRHAATINQRREFQQHRIGEGIRSGRLNARQGARLERREASIGRQEHHMRAGDHGRLNHFDRVRLNHRLNHTSRAIYRAKHGHARR